MLLQAAQGSIRFWSYLNLGERKKIHIKLGANYDTILPIPKHCCPSKFTWVILHSTTPNYENVLENIDFSAHSLQSPHKKQPPKHSK